MRLENQPDENVIRTIRIIAFSCAAVLSYIVLGQMLRPDPVPLPEAQTQWSQQIELPQQPQSPVDLPRTVVPPPPPLPKPANHRLHKAETQKAIEPIAARALAVDTRSEISSPESRTDQTR